MLLRSKFLPQFVEKIEKFKLSWSKQYNKMLKMRSKMLKNHKKSITINPGNPENFRDPGNFFLNFPFPGKMKIREKGKSLT